MAEEHSGAVSPIIPVDVVREGIRSAMAMGMPVEEEERPTFYFDSTKVYDYVDEAGKPFDWSVSPTVSKNPGPTRALCSWEFSAPLGRQAAHETPVGQFNPTTLILTVLDEDFDEVRGFRYVTIGPSDDKWWFRFYQPAVGLGDMTVYRITCSAKEPMV